MRLFIAVRLANDMRDTLINIQNEMLEWGIRGNYSKEENLHLTLAFIGEYSNAEKVLNAIQTVLFTPFEISLDGMGCFGDLWWAGMKESVPLAAVVRRLRRALAENDIPYDRKRFLPHITLVRKAVGEMKETRIPSVTMTVNAISLMQSERGRNGMIYTEIGQLTSTQN